MALMDLVESGRYVIEQEIKSLRSVADGLGEEFARAVRLIHGCQGRLIVTGVGKAGIIGRKIAATMASTGTPAYWMHAVEARHGDLGRVVPDDVVLVLSNSGETEVTQLLEPLKKLNTSIISITGNRASALARYSDVVLDIGRVEEACPLGLAPSCSTTAMLAVGDALALTIFKMRNWTREDYAFYHPGGELGRQLITVRQVMRTGTRNPVASQDLTVGEVLGVMSTEGSPGSVSLVDEDGRLAGVFTDGDLRRLLQAQGAAVLARAVRELMTRSPKTVSTESLAAEAYRIMRDSRIDNLPVVDEAGVPVGIVDVQDWLDVERGAENPAPETP